MQSVSLVLDPQVDETENGEDTIGPVQAQDMYQVLKRACPTLGISSKGMDAMLELARIIFQRIVVAAVERASMRHLEQERFNAGQPPFLPADVQSAVRTLFPNEMHRHANRHAVRALGKYKAAAKLHPFDWRIKRLLFLGQAKATTSPLHILNADALQLVISATQRAVPRTAAGKAGLLFSVPAIDRHLSRMNLRSIPSSREGVSFFVHPIEKDARGEEDVSVQLAAVLERLCRQIMEIASKQVRKESPRRRIAPCHISRAVLNDNQLRQFSTAPRRLRV